MIEDLRAKARQRRAQAGREEIAARKRKLLAEAEEYDRIASQLEARRRRTDALARLGNRHQHKRTASRPVTPADGLAFGPAPWPGQSRRRLTGRRTP
jgi:hypothetical protein